MRSGVRWAETTCASWAHVERVQHLGGVLIVAQSDWLPMMMATGFIAVILRGARARAGPARLPGRTSFKCRISVGPEKAREYNHGPAVRKRARRRSMAELQLSSGPEQEHAPDQETPLNDNKRDGPSSVEELRSALDQAQRRIRELEGLAHEDELTGVLNRRGFEQELRRAASYCERYGVPVTLALVDLDFFKQINDLHGHSAGDAALRETAGFLSRHVRASDVVARIGGDEFALLLWHASLADASAKLGGARRDGLARIDRSSSRQAVAGADQLRHRAVGGGPPIRRRLRGSRPDALSRQGTAPRRAPGRLLACPTGLPVRR